VKNKSLFFVVGLVALLALVATAILANPADAAKSGNGRNGGASLSIYQNGVQVNSVAPGTPIEVRGSGFRANTTVYVGLQGYIGMDQVTTDGAGRFILPKVAPSTPWTYTYVALVYSRQTWVIATSVSFQVL
jgi:hypothetical protein